MPETLSLKVPDATAARVDALVAAIQKSAPDMTARRSDALRAIVDAGLPIVEARYRVAPPAKTAKKRGAK